MTTLSVIIPAYNEENGITDIVGRVMSVRRDLESVGVDDLELIVVDDGSSDKTVELTRSMASKFSGINVICHAYNKGYGAALKTGFSNARGELIGFLDADGTYPPEYFPQLCIEALNGGDLVVGSRRSGAESEMPFVRRLGNLIWSNLVTVLGNQRVIDPASGMRVFKREVLERIYPLPDGLNLTPVMSTRAIHEGVHLVEVPIPYKERVGRSKLSVVRDGMHFLQTIVWTVLNYNPARALGLVGLVGMAFAALVVTGLVIARLSGVTALGPWGVAALFWALVSAVTGISLFALGATFNYLVSLFFKRPVRKGILGRAWLKTPVERHFGWLGGVTLLVGLIVGVVSVVLGVNGWEIARLWLYLLGSAMLILVGVQLIIYWVLIGVLEELRQREELTKKDLGIA